MVNKDCFFFVLNNALIFWDFKKHKQYQLSAEHAHKLISVIYEQPCYVPNDNVLQDLKHCEVINSPSRDEKNWGWDILSRLFHYGTKDIIIEQQPTSEHDWASQYLEHCITVLSEAAPAELSEIKENGIQLSTSKSDGEFEKLLKQRATVRNFHRASISSEQLGQILQYTLGFIDNRTPNNQKAAIEPFSQRRSSPSAGGLNATEGYVYIANVEGMEPGIYRYEASTHQLHWRNQLPPRLGDLLSGQHFANDIPAGLFLTCRLDKLWWKYKHSRAYRMALIEIGHIAQTFQLTATANGLSTWLTGALNECVIEPLLKLESGNEQVFFFVGCGHSDGSAIPDCLKLLLHNDS